MSDITNVLLSSNVIKERCPGFFPKVGLILGSGLGAISAQIKDPVIIDYKDLPGFAVTSIQGHAKRMLLGWLKGCPVVCLEGRTHLYEGDGAAASIRTIIRTLKKLGCEILLTTNAVGSLKPEVGPGSLMLITDHINFMFQNVLMGVNADDFGERFTSMDQAYDVELRKHLLDLANTLNISLTSGVYLATSGPVFETPAEIRAFKILGADAVGMSTVPETMVARHCGLRVASVCAITNLAAGLSAEQLSHEGTLKGAKLAVDNLIKLFLAFVENYNTDGYKNS